MVLPPYEMDRLKERSGPGSSTSFGSSTAGWLAPILDRLAAGAVDFLVVLAPSLLLLLAPFKRQMTEAILVANHTQFLSAIVFAVIVGAMTVFTYYFLSTAYAGRTVGQWMFGLTVVDVQGGNRLRLSAAALRSFVFILEIVFTPWLLLSAFSHRERRCWHDRVSDSVLLGLRRAGLAPKPWERGVVHGFYAALFLVSLLVLGATVSVLDEVDPEVAGMEGQLKALRLLGQTEMHNLCGEVSDYIQPKGRRASFEVDRLDAAMTLFAAGLVEPDCLRAEAEWQMRQEKRETALYYLAMSFVHVDKPDLSDEYLKTVCGFEEESEACWLSRMVESWSDRSALGELADNPPSNLSRLGMIWLARHFIREEESDRALAVLDQLAMWPGLTAFVASHRAKALWLGQKYVEARMTSQLALPLLPESSQVDLAGWMCYQELAKDCSSRAPSCHWIKEVPWQKLNEDESERSGADWIETAMVAEILRRQECQTEFSPGDSDELSNFFDSPGIKKYLAAINSSRELKELAGDRMVSQRIRSEAARRWIALTEDSNEAIEAVRRFAEEGLDDRILSMALWNRFTHDGRAKEALTVGVSIIGRQPGPETIGLRRKLVILAYQLGRKEDAWKLLKSYKSFLEWDRLGREPASEDEFAVVVRVLEKEFGK